MNILQNISIGSKWSLTARDWAQGAVMAAIGAVGGQLYAIGAQWIASDTFTGIDKHSLMLAAKGAIFSGLTYLAKRYMNKPDIIITNPTPTMVKDLKEQKAAVAVVDTTPVKDISTNTKN